MEMKKYALEGIPKLRRIALVEIVLGCLAVVGDISKLFQAETCGQLGGTLISLALAVVFLLATGSYGFDITKRSRAGELISPGSFRTLAILNIVLCALYCFGLVFLITLSFVCIDASRVVAVIIELLCIGMTIMAFKISRQNVAIIESSGMKTKKVEAEYQTPLPPYAPCLKSEAAKN